MRIPPPLRQIKTEERFAKLDGGVAKVNVVPPRERKKERKAALKMLCMRLALAGSKKASCLAAAWPWLRAARAQAEVAA